MNPDTAIGGDGRQFPSTLWSQIAEVASTSEGARRQAWERLASRYWKPIYLHIRVKWAKSNEDAKDLTQDFFGWMIESSLPSQAEPSRGRFRAFLRTALENYLRSDYRARHREKRGGDRPIRVLDSPSGLPELPDPTALSGEDVLERSWKDELLAEAVRILEETYRKEDKTSHFLIFNAYYLSGEEGLRHEDLARSHGIARSDVNNVLMDAKGRFRNILTSLVAETVRRPEDLREEMRDLFGSLFE